MLKRQGQRPCNRDVFVVAKVKVEQPPQTPIAEDKVAFILFFDRLR